VQLSADEIAKLSPQRNIPDRSPPLKLFVGGNELSELKRQSNEYAAACAARGLPVSVTTLPGHHHFSILNELASPTGAMTRALTAMIAAA
jgi:arylformamidase